MPPPADPLQLLTTAEVAALMRKSTGWVTKQRKSNALPHLQVGRAVRYYRADVEAFIGTFTPNAIAMPGLAQVIELRRAS